jgi:alpha-L-rhamnosidase
LQCEYVENPIGIEVPDPRLSWQIESPRAGERQTAYHVLVARTPENLSADLGDRWDSGKVETDRSAHVGYAGTPLRSRDRCFWKVRFWDSAGQPSAWSDPACWEMGLLKAADWKARWIKASRIENQADPVTEPAPWFRREFDLLAAVDLARVYFCGLGFSELYLNGRRVGDQLLSPNQTDYDVRRLAKLLYPFDDQTAKRMLYVIHDVTRYLKPGRNAIGVVLGNGWYNQRDRIVEALSWYGPPRLLFQLEARCAGGATVVVKSGAGWKVSTGPILHDGIFTGETYDARLEMPGWSTPGFDDAAWTEALPATAPRGALHAQVAPPDRITRQFHPIAMSEVRPGVFSYDAGENLAGWARVTLDGPRGRRVTLRFIEELGPDYHQADHYTLKGGGPETWEPRFTWHGFRHMEVTGSDQPPALTDVTFCSVHTDVAEAGQFACSNPLLTRLFENFRRTQLANMHCGVPSDCPHR